MKRCNFCNLNIRDNTSSCPLCGGVLEELVFEENTYPNVLKKTKLISFFFRLIIFLAIVSVTICVIVNYYLGYSYRWILLVALSFIYALWLMLLFKKEGTGYRMRILGGIIGGVLLVTFIDYSYGANRWSLNYVFPSAITAVDLIFLILMFINKRNWQSYTVLIIGTFIASLIPVILCFTGTITSPIMAQISFVFCLIVMTGVLLFGGNRVTSELKRRFYIGRKK